MVSAEGKYDGIAAGLNIGGKNSLYRNFLPTFPPEGYDPR